MKRLSQLLTTALLVAAIMTACKEPDTPTPEAAHIAISPESITLDAEGGVATITLESNYSWKATVTEGSDWLGISRLAGPEGPNQSLTVTAWDNTLEETRTGTITFHSRDAATILTVTQKGFEQSLNPEVDIPVAERANTFVIDGVERSFQTSSAMMVGENVALAATPEADGGSVENIMLNCNEYFYGAVSPLLVGKEFDLTTETKLFTFISTLVGASAPDGIAPEMVELVSSGKALFTYQEGVVKLQVGIVFKDGARLAVNIEAKEEVAINQNTITRGDEEKPVRAAFYMAEDGLTGLYMTPGGVDYFEELENAIWYMYLMIDDALMTGEEIDITTITDKTFMLGIVDNLDYFNTWSIATGELQGATGTIKVSKTAGIEASYSLVVNILIGDIRFTASYDGEFVDYALAPEENNNYFIYNKTQTTITSASIDISSDVWVATLSLADGKSVVVTIPESMCNGNMCGFSQSDDITVTYDGTTFSKAAGNMGTLALSFDISSGQLSTTFTNYAGCEFAYVGRATVE